MRRQGVCANKSFGKYACCFVYGTVRSSRLRNVALDLSTGTWCRRPTEIKMTSRIRFGTLPCDGALHDCVCTQSAILLALSLDWAFAIRSISIAEQMGRIAAWHLMADHQLHISVSVGAVLEVETTPAQQRKNMHLE